MFKCDRRAQSLPEQLNQRYLMIRDLFWSISWCLMRKLSLLSDFSTVMPWL